MDSEIACVRFVATPTVGRLPNRVCSYVELWDYLILENEGVNLPMSEKMPERTKALIVNVAIVAALIWCYFRGYALNAILISGIVILTLANTLMYLKRR